VAKRHPERTRSAQSARGPRTALRKYGPLVVSFILVAAGVFAAWDIMRHNHPDDDHTHEPFGVHGGLIVSIGEDEEDHYHAEFLFEKGGLIKLYMLGDDAETPQEVVSQPVVAHVKGEGDREPTSVVLRPIPQPPDRMGKTSTFLAKLPNDLRGRPIAVRVPEIIIGGRRFDFAFTSPASADPADAPAKVREEEERLFLTPGGKYTDADIAANGDVTARLRLGGVKIAHDLHPKPGDAICPITGVKADARITWVIGGKAYEFCCPPCVDEFVQLAKAMPEAVKEPETYKMK